MEKYVYAHHNFNNNFGYEWGKGYNENDKKMHYSVIEEVLSEINLPISAYSGKDNLGYMNDQYEYMYFFPGEVTLSCKEENYDSYMEILNHYFGGLDKSSKQFVEECYLFSDNELAEQITDLYKSYSGIFNNVETYDGLHDLKTLLKKELKDVRIVRGLNKIEEEFLNKVFVIFDKIK